MRSGVREAGGQNQKCQLGAATNADLPLASHAYVRGLQESSPKPEKTVSNWKVQDRYLEFGRPQRQAITALPVPEERLSSAADICRTVFNVVDR